MLTTIIDTQPKASPKRVEVPREGQRAETGALQKACAELGPHVSQQSALSVPIGLGVLLVFCLLSVVFGLVGFDQTSTLDTSSPSGERLCDWQIS